MDMKNNNNNLKIKNLNIKFKTKYSNSSSIYLFLLNYFGINPAEGQEPIVNYILGVASLSLIAILCLINIMIYLLVILIINKYSNLY